jgi:excisionase family DNA binding protein
VKPTPSPLDPPVKLLTVREAAELLRLSERTVWQVTKAGQLRAVRLGKRVVYDPADLKQFVELAKSPAPLLTAS